MGYFSSTSIVAVSQGLAALIEAGGKMRLVASPCLSTEDIKAIEKGLRQRKEVISSVIIKEFEKVSRDRLACLSWLLSQGVLDIRLAVANNFEDPGLYHEKIGILTDDNDNKLAFTGSINETKSGLIDNFENIEFLFLAGGRRKRVKRICEYFEKLWSNKTHKAEIIRFPEAAARKLLEYRPYAKPTVARKLTPQKKFKLVAENQDDYKLNKEKKRSHSLDTTLRPYQEEALIEFKSADNKGILAMATGAGKTITALACASSIEDLDLIIIVVPPNNDLVEQWMSELDKLTDFYYPIAAVGKSDIWREILRRKLNLIHGNVQKIKRLPTVLVGTYSGLSKSTVAELIEDAGGLPIKSLIIADEVHAAGAKNIAGS